MWREWTAIQLNFQCMAIRGIAGDIYSHSSSSFFILKRKDETYAKNYIH